MLGWCGGEQSLDAFGVIERIANGLAGVRRAIGWWHDREQVVGLIGQCRQVLVRRAARQRQGERVALRNVVACVAGDTGIRQQLDIGCCCVAPALRLEQQPGAALLVGKVGQAVEPVRGIGEAPEPGQRGTRNAARFITILHAWQRCEREVRVTSARFGRGAQQPRGGFGCRGV